MIPSWWALHIWGRPQRCTESHQYIWGAVTHGQGHQDGTNDRFWVSGVVPDLHPTNNTLTCPSWISHISSSRFTTYSYQTRSARSSLHTCCSSSCKLTWTKCSRPGVHYILPFPPWPPFFYCTRAGSVHIWLCLIFHAHTKWFIYNYNIQQLATKQATYKEAKTISPGNIDVWKGRI